MTGGGGGGKEASTQNDWKIWRIIEELPSKISGKSRKSVWYYVNEAYIMSLHDSMLSPLSSILLWHISRFHHRGHEEKNHLIQKGAYV